MAAAGAPVRLSDLRAGTMARFQHALLDRDVSCFLRALGLTQSCEFRLCKNGEPCIVQVRSTRIGLSRAVAGRIFVSPIGCEGC
ncbi:MAG TPA: FeoA family protein [Vicinamibacterales bacterium]|nr:FeoA family protein [Vicinamibacterales bacterium]